MGVRSVRPWESDLWGRESPICEAVRGHERPCGSPIDLSRTPAEAMRLAVKSVRRPRGWQHRPVESDRTLTASQIGLSNLWGRSVRPWESEHGLSLESHVICQRVRSASQIGLPRPHRSASQIWESDRPLTHSDRTPGEAMRLAVKSVRRARGSDCIARCPIAVRERPIGLSNLWGRGALWLAQTDHMTKVRGRERPWEAVRGRGALIGLEIYLSQSGEHGLPRPLTASQIRPLKHIKYIEISNFRQQ